MDFFWVGLIKLVGTFAFLFGFCAYQVWSVRKR